MRHGLSAVRTAIVDQTVACLRNSQLNSNLLRYSVNLTDQRQIFSRDIIHRSDELLRDKQHMHRCGRLNIVECQYPLVLEHFFGRD
ncbi:hypothetical protein D3C71_1908900 [compost metagenome]